jgi:hypothetical protein
MISIIQFIAIRSIQGTIRSDNHRLILQNILTAVLSVVFVGTQVGSTINKGKNE